MMQRKHSFIFLVLVLLLGQGSLFVHDMNHHMLEEEVSDCLFCNKLDKPELALPAANLLEITALTKGEASLYSCTKHENRGWRTCQSRAPPATV
jgi:hypothetical protein